MNAQTHPRPVAVITGASSGIGAVYADRFAARGHDLVLVARRGDRLAEMGNRLWTTYGVTVRPLVADLSTEQGIAAVEALLENDAGVTVLVNNAGLSRLGRFIDLSPADHTSLLMVNAVAPSRLARAALPGFVARDTGTIINIASANAVSPYPGTTVYSATKSFVLSLSLGLQNEVEGTGVRVQAVVPASTATEVWDGMGIDLKDLPPDTVMSAEAMVDAALTGLDLGEAVTFPSVADPALPANFVAAGRDLFAAAQTGTPAPRYRSAKPATFGIGQTALALGLLALLSVTGAPPLAAEEPDQAIIDRGEYLVAISGCNDCHTPGYFTGAADMSRFLGGSDAGFEVPGLGVFVGPNLTPDVETGLGGWTTDDIVIALRTGVRPDGRVLAPVMPWPNYSHLSDEDAKAIAAYLQRLDPISHDVPGPFGPGETVSTLMSRILPPGQIAAPAPE